MVTSRKVRAFKNWMKSQGLECSDALDLVVTENSSAVSIRALCDLDDGDLVASIPKESCLTVKTSGARQMIEEAELEGILALAVAIMYERSLGPLSPWFGYLQLLPYSEPIPLLWSLSEIDSLLAGTELHKVEPCNSQRQFVEVVERDFLLALLRKHSLSYLRNLKSLSTPRTLSCPSPVDPFCSVTGLI